MVVMAVVIGTLVGAIALGTDVGVLYYNWVQLQKAADAAALAGASSLTAVADPTGTVAANAISVAKGYACLNGINDPKNTNSTICPNPVQNATYVDQVKSTTVNPANTQLSIQLARQVPYFFGKVLGLGTGSVAAAATAQVSAPINNYQSGLFPVGIQCTNPCSLANLDPGQPVVYGTKFVGGLAPGNWSWLDLGQGNGASQLGTAIANGVQGNYSVGDTITSSPGNKGNSNPVQTGFQTRLDAHNARFSNVDPNSVCNSGGGNPTNIPLGDPLLVTLPAVDFTGCHGKCSMTIEGFVDVYLTGMTGSEIDGCLVQAVTPGGSDKNTAPALGAISPPILIQ